ncbi:hypothetical protein ACFL3Y_00810 [Pseudomonadota bacterium]
MLNKSQYIASVMAPVGLSLVLGAGSAWADTAAKSADEVAKELANPAGSLASLNFNMQYQTFQGDLPGADSQDSSSLIFQPTMPFSVGDKGRRIIFRPAVPVLFDQPVFEAGEGEFDDLNTNLGDITFDLVYAGTEITDKATKSGFLWGVGLAGTVPTATNNALGGDQWRFGPEVFGGIIRSWGIVGALVSNQWNLGGGDGGLGSNDQDYSATTAQYFYAYGLGNGWQIAASPIITYNWKAEDSDQALALPVGAGLAKTMSFGDNNWKFQGQVQYYVEQPDAFGPEWLFKFTVTPVVNNPFAR